MFLSSLSQLESLIGCTLVVNLNPDFSFDKTIPAGTDAITGETILHMPARTKIKKDNINKGTSSTKDNNP